MEITVLTLIVNTGQVIIIIGIMILKTRQVFWQYKDNSKYIYNSSNIWKNETTNAAMYNFVLVLNSC